MSYHDHDKIVSGNPKVKKTLFTSAQAVVTAVLFGTGISMTNL